MDDLSYYATIGAVVLIQVSFFWLLRDDLRTRRLTKEDINYELAVILANANHRIAKELDEKLDELGFRVYKLCFVDDQQLKLENGTFRLNLRCPEHFELASKFIEDELRNDGKLLHAYISLPITYEKYSPVEWHKLIQDSLLPHSKLIVSMTNLIIMHKARIINSYSIGRSNSSSPRDCLYKLARSLHTGICRFIFAKQLERGLRLIEVRICEEGSSSEERRDSNLVSAYLRGLAAATFGGNVSNGKSGIEMADIREIGLNSPRINDDRLDSELVSALIDSTLRVSPQQMSIVI